MLRDLSEAYRQDRVEQPASTGADHSLQAVLWTLWTIAVAVTAYLNWHADVVAQRPIDLLGLGIHTALAGVVGLLVITLIEMRLEPLRFLD